ncbi:unnamed protein product [Leuciscus chuanchicus]
MVQLSPMGAQLAAERERGVFGDDEVKRVSVKEGDSFTLNSDLTEIKDDDDVIQWRFGYYENALIAEINKRTDRIAVYDDVLDGRFRDRLKLDNQTGSLTITDITTEHGGYYSLQINSERKRNFSVDIQGWVFVSVKEGESFTLNSDLTEIKDDDVIQWRFGFREDTLIAEINKRAGRIAVYDDVLDGRFRDRLKLNNQTGSLTITNIRPEQIGYYSLQINSERKRKFSVDIIGSVTSVSVKEGESVTLNSHLIEIKGDSWILWMFGDENTLISEINKRTNRIAVYDDVLDGRFRDRLKLNNQTGSLTITDITTEHAGVYERRLPRSISYVFLTFLFVDTVEISVKEGESLTVNSNLTEKKDYDWIRWMFGDENILIAEINVKADRITVYDDYLGRFRDRLKLNNQTGSLTITNITTEHAGDYKLQIKTRLPVPVISRDCSSSSSSSSCSLVCSAVNVGHVTLSWYKGNSLLSSISVFYRHMSLSLPLEVEYQDKNSYICVLNNPISNQTQHLNITQLCHTCSGPWFHLFMSSGHCAPVPVLLLTPQGFSWYELGSLRSGAGSAPDTAGLQLV